MSDKQALFLKEVAEIKWTLGYATTGGIIRNTREIIERQHRIILKLRKALQEHVNDMEGMYGWMDGNPQFEEAKEPLLYDGKEVQGDG